MKRVEPVRAEVVMIVEEGGVVRTRFKAGTRVTIGELEGLQRLFDENDALRAERPELFRTTAEVDADLATERASWD